MSLHICRILSTTPLTHSNDASHPSVCLLVISRWHTVACCMLSLILARISSFTIGDWEKKYTLNVHLSCTETKWSTLSGLSLWRRERVWKPTVAFFLSWSIFFCSSFGRLTKKPDNWRHSFFMWESAYVMHRENAIFSLKKKTKKQNLTVVYRRQMSKSTSVSRVAFIKVIVWKEPSLIFNQSMLCKRIQNLLVWFWKSTFCFEVGKCKTYVTLDTRKQMDFSAEFACY